VKMTAAGLERPVRQGFSSLEVRWILPGQLDTAVAEWFARSPPEMESREDVYLVRPQLNGLSVKVRAGRALEVKAFRGSPGILDIPGRVRGRTQYWQKWSFACRPAGRDSGDPDGWTRVRKQRRTIRFSLARGRITAGAPASADDAQCAVELTAFRVRDQDWWTLGLEATGPVSLFRPALEVTAASVFARALPGGAELGMDDCMSYAEWLRTGSPSVGGP
jgi:hypothetical protein